MKTYDIAIVGGGLAGLTASVYLARAGFSVVLLEKSAQIGGRAITIRKNGVLFNLGIHALYQGGAAEQVLNELNVKVEGGAPASKAGIVWNDRFHAFPGNGLSLLTSKLFSGAALMELGKLIFSLGKTDLNHLPPMSLREWAEESISDPMVRHFIYAVCRANSFVPDPDAHLAAPGIRQLQRSFRRKAFYVDHGWGFIVKGLEQKAIQEGVTVLKQQNVKQIAFDGVKHTIHVADGETLRVNDVVMAAGLRESLRLFKGAEQTSLSRWGDDSQPIFAACLDIALHKLPKPDLNRSAVFFLGQPLFLVTPSNFSKASDDGSAIVQVVKHLGTDRGESNPKQDEKQLEKALDLIQPGWRSEVAARQFLPRMTVVHGFNSVNTPSKAIGPAVPEIPGLYVAGDWVGHGELLADTAFASGKRAAEAIILRHEHESKSRSKTI
ncbi:phytoene desaturase family protein [Aureibacillus halotolerans]|uniref:Phytoene dehydrogenase-like protein n=1 Tax=Aureibacillus halotolerans TaxID=1508390 RepID=A0A4V3D5J9_9BACI|nr:FAD-dependent oxidoreductase [Aureibacillus halotolerans]TDQ40387.1 phytoene dehydrogenase-like protein [Aureibacillus halotolerans]